MATTRIKDLSKTATTVASDANIVIDGPSNGTQKITRDNFRQDTADAFVAAPSTYKLAPLNGVNKIDATYLPTSGDTPKGEWNASSNSPALADGSGVAGDYYDVTTAGTQNLGSGSITFTVGDVVKYNGSTWFKIDSVANILDGSATAADGRSALSVNSRDEDAQANALKVTAPALYFNGTSSVVTVADDDKLSFTDGTNDLPFSASAWVKMSDATSFIIASKYGGTSATREWVIDVDSSDKLRLFLQDTSGNQATLISDTALTAYEGEWVHLACTYGGAGPSAASGAAFTASMSGGNAVLYVNATAVSATASSPSYGGMSNTSQVVYLGRLSGSYAEGSIRDVKIFNRELTASEVAELARGNDLGFSEEWGGAFGGEYTSDFTSDSTDSWTAVNTTFDAASTVGGDSDNLKIVANSSTATHSAYRSTGMVFGKRYRLSFDYYLPSGQSNVDGLQARAGSGGQVTVVNLPAATQDAWTRASGEFLNTATTNPQLLYMYITDAGNPSFTDAGADDYVAIRNVTITEIGTLADFRAERYDTSTNKLYDISDNAFVGTGTSVSLTGREVPVYETGTWTPSITFGGGSTGITYSAQEGNYTRIGRIVYVSGYFVLTSKGTDTGSAKINGLPFTAVDLGAQTESFVVNRTANMASLTSAITGNVDDNATTFALYDHGAAGSTTVDDTNFTNTSVIRFSGTYQIQ